MSRIIKRLYPETIKKTATRCRQRKLRIPTFKELRHPELIPPSVTAKLKGVGLWDVNPVNLFRITWKNDVKSGLYGKVKITVLAPPDKTAIAPAGSADMVLTFRNIHNWMAAGTADQVFAAMFAALKPGGVLGVVEHRGNPAVPQDPKAKSGYVNQDYAIRLAEKAGFKFVEGSEINANPRDTKDHPKGVWTLPPTFALEDEDRAKYLAIGESDRFTLKFVKP